MLFIRPDRPINPRTIEVMREVDTITREIGLRYFVCGAMARDILLLHVHGIEPETATVDVDFGIAVENWQQFEDIKARIIGTGRFEAVKNMSQRLFFKSGTSGYRHPLDIIPFGNVENPPNSITWPPDGDVTMNVIGYVEALENIVAVQIEKDLSVPVISLPGLAILKLFAWTDRGSYNSKDALDFATLLLRYHEAGNQDRLYGEELAILAVAEYDLQNAGTQLLGKDVRGITKPETLARILAILNDAKLADRLATHIAPRVRYADDRIVEAKRILEAFRAGLN